MLVIQCVLSWAASTGLVMKDQLLLGVQTLYFARTVGVDKLQMWEPGSPEPAIFHCSTDVGVNDRSKWCVHLFLVGPICGLGGERGREE